MGWPRRTTHEEFVGLGLAVLKSGGELPHSKAYLDVTANGNRSGLGA